MVNQGTRSRQLMLFWEPLQLRLATVTPSLAAAAGAAILKYPWQPNNLNAIDSCQTLRPIMPQNSRTMTTATVPLMSGCGWRPESNSMRDCCCRRGELAQATQSATGAKPPARQMKGSGSQRWQTMWKTEQSLIFICPKMFSHFLRWL